MRSDFRLDVHVGEVFICASCPSLRQAKLRPGAALGARIPLLGPNVVSVALVDGRPQLLYVDAVLRDR